MNNVKKALLRDLSDLEDYEDRLDSILIMCSLLDIKIFLASTLSSKTIWFYRGDELKISNVIFAVYIQYRENQFDHCRITYEKVLKFYDYEQAFLYIEDIVKGI